MIVFLELEHNGQPIDRVPARRAHVQVVVPGDKGSNQLIEFVVDLGQGEIVETEHLAGKHSYIDSAYMKDVERACLADERVQAEIRTLDLPCNASVCVEPWAYATDGMNDMSERITMVRVGPPVRSSHGLDMQATDVPPLPLIVLLLHAPG